MVRKVRLLAILFFLLLAVFPVNLYARVNFVVTPSKLEMFVKRGETTSRSIKVYNKEDKPLKIRVYLRDYRINPDNTFVFSPPGQESYSAATWFELKKTEFTVPGKNPVEVPFTLKVPPEAEAGGHYAVIFFEVAEKTKKEGMVRGRIGVLILVTVEGEVNRIGKIAQFEVINPFYSRNVQTELTFSNEGNVHITTRATVTFEDITFGASKGKKVGEESLGEITALPKTKRIMEVKWKNPPLFGKFKAKIILAYGSDLNTFNVVKSAEKTFWIIPWLFIAAFGGTAILLYFALRYLRRTYKIERK